MLPGGHGEDGPGGADAGAPPGRSPHPRGGTKFSPGGRRQRRQPAQERHAQAAPRDAPAGLCAFSAAHDALALAPGDGRVTVFDTGTAAAPTPGGAPLRCRPSAVRRDVSEPECDPAGSGRLTQQLSEAIPASAAAPASGHLSLLASAIVWAIPPAPKARPINYENKSRLRLGMPNLSKKQRVIVASFGWPVNSPLVSLRDSNELVLGECGGTPRRMTPRSITGTTPPRARRRPRASGKPQQRRAPALACLAAARRGAALNLNQQPASPRMPAPPSCLRAGSRAVLCGGGDQGWGASRMGRSLGRAAVAYGALP